jgi:hypothetical protein
MNKLVCTLTLTLSLALALVCAKPARADKHPTNACGCYTLNNSCFCEKKAKCGCPGECEPKGCEAERQKQLQKEIDEETRKAKEAEKAKEEAKAATDKKDDGEEATKDGAKDASKASAKGGKAVRKMTAAQKKQLAKLIDAYLAENPDDAGRSVSDVRGDLE